MAESRSSNGLEDGVASILLMVLLGAPLAFGSVAPKFLLWSQYAIATALVLWAIRWTMAGRVRLLFTPTSFFALAFTSYAIGRYIFTEVEYSARLEIILIVLCAAFFFLTMNTAYRQSWTMRILAALCVYGAALSLWAVYQFATESKTVWGQLAPESYGRRAGGPFICPNHLAGFLEMLIPISLASALASRLPHTIRIGFGYLAALMVAGVAVTLSRAGCVAVGVSVFGLLAVLVTRKKYRIPALAVSVVLFGAAFWIAKDNQFVATRLNDLGLREGKVQNIRTLMWEPAVELWQTNPTFGIGPGQYDHRMYAYRDEAFQLRAGYVHNDYLQTLTEYGVVGVLIVAAALVSLGVGIQRNLPHIRRDEEGLSAKNSNKLAVTLGISFGLFAMLVHSFFDFNLHIPANAFVFCALLGILSSMERHRSNQFWIKADRPVRAFVALISLASAFFLGFEAYKRQGEISEIARAGSGELETFTAQIEAVEKALAIEPSNYDSWTILGNYHRAKLAEGGDGAREHGDNAISAYLEALALNPYDYHVCLLLGAVLDTMGREADANDYYRRAESLDPNGAYTLAHVGGHYLRNMRVQEANEYLRRSKRLNPLENRDADRYLEILRTREEF